jgi:protoporphyrin/coproporphyrin ferrochelatase
MRKAVLIVNTGSPSTPKTADVRKYLREFLSDKRVLDMPWIVRKALIEFLILPFRSQKSAAKYRQVWTDEGSPLLSSIHRQTDALQSRVDMPVYTAMRYGTPSIRSVAEALRRDATQRLLLIPMFPQYATSTYESVVVKTREVFQKIIPSMRIDVMQPFYEEPAYIDALVASAKPFLGDGFQRLLFSYHSLPERHMKKCDPSHQHCLVTRDCCRVAHPAHATCYRHQCLKTTELFVKRAGVNGDLCAISFQSRFGGGAWLGPSTRETIRRFGEEKIGTLLVITPGFTADCLETIDELGNAGRQLFHESGGGELVLIPCLGDSPPFMDFLAAKIRDWSQKL